MLYARIKDDKVAELAEIDGLIEGRFHPSLVFMPAPPGCAEGWLLAGGVLLPPPPDLDALRAAKRRAIEIAWVAAVDAGMPWAGKVLQIDDASRQNIGNMALLAGLVVQGVEGMEWPADMAWRMADNSWLPLSAGEMLTMASAVVDRYRALRLNVAALKDALAAAVTVEAIAAVDPSTGWI